MSKRNSKP